MKHAPPTVRRLKQFRAVAASSDKLASGYRSGLLLASFILWLR